jgi:hypothetical protein
MTANHNKARIEFISGIELGKLKEANGIIKKPPNNIDQPIRTFLSEFE